jgi:Flp pilus assembly protein TadB
VAQTKKKRRRKHRGTQGGRVDDRPKGRPRNRAEARQQAKARRAGGGRKRGAAPARELKPPSWGGAFTKGMFAALLFFALLVIAFGRELAPSAAIAGAMVLFYTPMAYFTDQFFYNRRLRKVQQARARPPEDS